MPGVGDEMSLLTLLPALLTWFLPGCWDQFSPLYSFSEQLSPTLSPPARTSVLSICSIPHDWRISPLPPTLQLMVQESGLYSTGGTRELWLEEEELLCSLILPITPPHKPWFHISYFTCTPKLVPVTWPSSWRLCLSLCLGLSKPIPIFHFLLLKTLPSTAFHTTSPFPKRVGGK